MNFIIKFGNLVKERATFIVNASNTELILGSGVSDAFREQCGGDYYQEELYDIKKRIGDIKQGDIVVSDSGKATNFKYALHVAVMNYATTAKSTHPTYMQIHDSLNSILNIVKEKIKNEDITHPSLVIPLFGCGVGGLKKEKVFLMIKSIFKKIDFDLKVIIYFHDKKDFIEFYSKV